MPSSLRYGSGLFDIPTAGVLPHRAISATYSGFRVSVDRRVLTDATGRGVAFGGEFSKWMSDASVAVGLFDRVELGATLQSFADADNGGTMAGGFGHVAILSPQRTGLGLGVGARFVTAPSYDAVDPNVNFQPPRLGFPDARLRDDYGAGVEEVNTTFSPYAVATAYLAGVDSDVLPRHDVTLTLGYGLGMFQEGNELNWNSFASSQGWFAGSAVHVQVGQDKLLNVMGEYNGFDVNAGVQLDLSGIRIGAFVLGANYLEKVTEYRSAKFGVLGSVAFCPGNGGLCKSHLLPRAKPDTVQLPAPPPDTVIVTREVTPPLPTGTPASLCLATGEEVQILVTAQSDTLLGPQRVSVRTLRPAAVFAGTYAQGRDWFTRDEQITFERRRYAKFGEAVSLRCSEIVRVGEHQGVPLFARTDAQRPYNTLYVPVRPGVWQAYQTGVGRTRGE
ncbi:MAG: hypothetical protein HY704_13060 [Gemmatimonadetes bacterium]|nr:hypothetical protein [Gemmatimonadota bacterium]